MVEVTREEREGTVTYPDGGQGALSHADPLELEHGRPKPAGAREAIAPREAAIEPASRGGRGVVRPGASAGGGTV